MINTDYALMKNEWINTGQQVRKQTNKKWNTIMWLSNLVFKFYFEFFIEAIAIVFVHFEKQMYTDNLYLAFSREGA